MLCDKLVSLARQEFLIGETGLPLAASQIHAVKSGDAVTMRRPSGLNAALSTTSL